MLQNFVYLQHWLKSIWKVFKNDLLRIKNVFQFEKCLHILEKMLIQYRRF